MLETPTISSSEEAVMPEPRQVRLFDSVTLKHADYVLGGVHQLAF
jgi:hypothetical protein